MPDVFEHYGEPREIANAVVIGTVEDADAYFFNL